jgi:hypothetical protein
MTAGDLDYFSTRPLTERQAFIAMRLFVNRFLGVCQELCVSGVI